MRARTAGLSNCLPGTCRTTINAMVDELRGHKHCETMPDHQGLDWALAKHEARVARHIAEGRLDKLKHTRKRCVWALNRDHPNPA